MTAFSRDTALVAEGDHFAGAIVPGWDIVGNANGGYLMAILGRAALLQSARPDVVSLSAEFLAPGPAGPISARADVIKSGRRFAVTRASLENAETRILTGTVVSGDLDRVEGADLVLADAPVLPPPDECIRSEPAETFPPPFVGQVDVRIHPDDVFLAPDPTLATVRAWFRLLDDEPMDSLAVVLASDALPPAIFNTHLDIGWVPTVQMTVHVRRRPATRWLRVHTRTRFVTRGLFEVDADLWDTDGALVAQSRQLALVSRPTTI